MGYINQYAQNFLFGNDKEKNPWGPKDGAMGSGLGNFAANFGTDKFLSGLSSGGGKMFQPSMGFANGGLVPPIYANEGYNGSPEGSVPMDSNADVPGLMTPPNTTDLGGVVPRIGQGLGGLPPDPTSRYSQDLSDPRGLMAPMGTGYLGADGKSGGGGGGGGRGGKTKLPQEANNWTQAGVNNYAVFTKHAGADPAAAARYVNFLEQQDKLDPTGRNRIFDAGAQLAGARLNAAMYAGGDMNAWYRAFINQGARDFMPSTQYKATGGVVGMHPGEPRGTDTVPAWLTPGEAVLTPQATQAIGGKPAVDALNSVGKGGLYAAAQQRGLPPVRGK